MGEETIHKKPQAAATANLKDYDAARRAFRWDDARRQLDGLPGGGLNIAYEAVDTSPTARGTRPRSAGSPATWR
jgi:acetyl-CoA synthetase